MVPTVYEWISVIEVIVSQNCFNHACETLEFKTVDIQRLLPEKKSRKQFTVVVVD